MARPPLRLLALCALHARLGDARLEGVRSHRAPDQLHAAHAALIMAKPSPADEIESVKRHAGSTVAKAAKVRPMQMIKDDMMQVVHSFMPGKRPDPTFYILPAVGVAVALCWFSFYSFVIYMDDREEHLDRWSQRKRVARAENDPVKHVKPDLVLMFHHPGHEGYAERHDTIDEETIRSVIVRPKNKTYLPRLRAIAEAEAGGDGALMRMAATMRNLQGGAEEADTEVAGEGGAPKRTIFNARNALLQDLYSSLPANGYEVFCWSSVDDDELFVGVSLEDDEVARDELLKSNTKLQLKPAVVAKLGIGQDPAERESSPPYMKYDIRMRQNVMGENSKDQDFYRTFHGKSQEGSIISGADRIRLLHRHISSYVNLDVAKEAGILKDWYPSHSTHWVTDLDACWAAWGMLLDLSVVQPINFIKSYFGSRVAFTFAWNGLYSKMLLAILPVAMVFELATFVNVMLGTSFFVKGAVTSFSVIVVIWSRVASNLWEREQEYFCNLWNLASGPDFSVRPDFQGTKEVSPVDSTQKVKMYSPRKAFLRRLGAWIATLLFCTLVAGVVFVWLNLFQGRMDVYASICLTIMIQVFQFIFNKMAESLTKFENHKYQNDFYNNYLAKLFIFQFINQYSAFFYIAVKQNFTEAGCPKDDCILLLKQQLSMTLLMLTVLRVVQVVVSTLQVWIALYMEDRAMRKELEGTGKDIPVRAFLEEQSKYEEFRIRAQIEGMVQLVVALGYVLIFGSVAPRIVPLCLCVFLVQLRATAYQCTTTCRRPLPRQSAGLGAWVGIVQFLNVFGVLFSGFLLVVYGPSFQGTYLLTKVSGFIVFVAMMASTWVIVTIFCPRSSNGAKLLVQRRAHVEEKVIQASEQANIQSLRGETKTGPVQSPRGKTANAREIEAGEWEKITRLVVDSDLAKLKDEPVETEFGGSARLAATQECSVQ